MLNCALHGGLIRRRIAYPTKKISFRRSCHGVVIFAPPLIVAPCSRHMYFPHTPAPEASSATAKGLATLRFDHAAALVRSASSTVARTAGATFAGGSRDGGVVINDGGESPSTLFWSLYFLLMLVRGGLGGGEMFPRATGNPFGRGQGVGTRVGATNTVPGGATILGSASGLELPGC